MRKQREFFPPIIESHSNAENIVTSLLIRTNVEEKPKEKERGTIKPIMLETISPPEKRRTTESPPPPKKRRITESTPSPPPQLLSPAPPPPLSPPKLEDAAVVSDDKSWTTPRVSPEPTPKKSFFEMILNPWGSSKQEEVRNE